jgi:predicted RNase H-like HicB family nuclease
MATITFRIIIEPDERGTFHGYVPALPGCHTWGKTITETRRHLRDAMRAYLKSLNDDGIPIPRDTGFELIETFEAKEVAAVRRSPAYA